MTFSSCRKAKFPSPLFEKTWLNENDQPLTPPAFSQRKPIGVSLCCIGLAHTPLLHPLITWAEGHRPHICYSQGARPQDAEVGQCRLSVCVHTFVQTSLQVHSELSGKKVVIRKGHRTCYVSIKQKRFEMSNSCLQSVVWNVLNSCGVAQGVSHDFCQRRTAEFLQHASHRLLHGSSLQWATEGLVRASLALKTTIVLRYIVENIRLDNSETKTCSFEKI